MSLPDFPGSPFWRYAPLGGSLVSYVARGKPVAPPLQPKALLAQAELFDQGAVALNVSLLEVVQNVTTTAHKLQQTRA